MGINTNHLISRIETWADNNTDHADDFQEMWVEELLDQVQETNLNLYNDLMIWLTENDFTENSVGVLMVFEMLEEMDRLKQN